MRDFHIIKAQDNFLLRTGQEKSETGNSNIVIRILTIIIYDREITISFIFHLIINANVSNRWKNHSTDSTEC